MRAEGAQGGVREVLSVREAEGQERRRVAERRDPLVGRRRVRVPHREHLYRVSTRVEKNQQARIARFPTPSGLEESPGRSELEHRVAVDTGAVGEVQGPELRGPEQEPRHAAQRHLVPETNRPKLVV